MFRKLLFFIFFIIGLCGCFGYKTNLINTTVAQNQVALTPQIENVGVPKNKGKTRLTFAKPKNIIYVAIDGNNKTGDGSLNKPVRTLA